MINEVEMIDIKGVMETYRIGRSKAEEYMELCMGIYHMPHKKYHKYEMPKEYFDEWIRGNSRYRK